MSPEELAKTTIRHSITALVIAIEDLTDNSCLQALKLIREDVTARIEAEEENQSRRIATSASLSQ